MIGEKILLDQKKMGRKKKEMGREGENRFSSQSHQCFDIFYSCLDSFCVSLPGSLARKRHSTVFVTGNNRVMAVISEAHVGHPRGQPSSHHCSRGTDQTNRSRVGNSIRAHLLIASGHTFLEHCGPYFQFASPAHGSWPACVLGGCAPLLCLWIPTPAAAGIPHCPLPCG